MEDVRVLVNHIGYEPQGYKNAVLQISCQEEDKGCPEGCDEVEMRTKALEEFIGVNPKQITGTLLPLHITPADEAYRVPLQSYGEVSGWKGRRYYCFDFSYITTPGEYCFEVRAGKNCYRSQPFKIEERLQAEEC